MSKDFGCGDLVDCLLIGGALYGEVLDIAEKGKVLEETSTKPGEAVTFLLEMAVVNCEFPSVEVRAVGCCGDGIGPPDEVGGGSEGNTTKDVSSAAGDPRFRDQGATSKAGFVRVEVIEDFVDDFGGYVDNVSVTLAARGKL